MTIYEAGLLFRGFTLINSIYHESSGENIDMDLRSGLLSAIITFAENAFSSGLMEYLEGTRFVIAFTHDTIMSEDSNEPELFLGYAIIDKRKKLEKYIHKIIMPLLSQCIIKFKSEYEGRNMSEVSLFFNFKNYIDSIFLPKTKVGSKIKTAT